MRPFLRQPCGLPLMNANANVPIPHDRAVPLTPPLVTAASAMKVVNTSSKVIKVTNGLDGTVNITFSPKPTSGSWGLVFDGIGASAEITDLADGTIVNTLQEILDDLLGSESVIVQGNYTDGIQLIFPQQGELLVPTPTFNDDYTLDDSTGEISLGDTQKRPTMVFYSTPSLDYDIIPVVLGKGQTLSAQALDDSSDADTGFLVINFFQ